MKYQIWDKKSNIITPIGEVLTPEQWVTRYPMTGVEGIKTVIGGGVVNGTVCMEFTGFVDNYKRAGCDFTGCETDQDILNAIEAFENSINNSISLWAITYQLDNTFIVKLTCKHSRFFLPSRVNKVINCRLYD